MRIAERQLLEKAIWHTINDDVSPSEKERPESLARFARMPVSFKLPLHYGNVYYVMHTIGSGRSGATVAHTFSLN